MASEATFSTDAAVPRHVAIIMDGNGRWAEARGLMRHAGHKQGIAPVRMCIEQCLQRRIGALTLFAFSSENWHRPQTEVANIMTLFLESLDREVAELHANGVRMRFIGDRSAMAVRLQARMADAEMRTAGNTSLALQVAVSYGGRWDIVRAARTLAQAAALGTLRPDEIDETRVAAALSLGDVPDPDLFIRTGGEHRISNFLLWSLAYTELWFTDTLWPDFDVAALESALAHFAARERRFGRTAGQVSSSARA